MVAVLEEALDRFRAPQEASAPQPRPPSLRISDLKLFEFENARWHLTVDAGVDVAALAPSYWVPVAQKLKPFDQIVVLWRDGRKFFELLVVQSSVAGADIVTLRAIDIPEFKPRDTDDLPEGYFLKKDPTTGMWQAFKPDGTPMGSPHPQRELVRMYVLSHPAVTQPQPLPPAS